MTLMKLMAATVTGIGVAAYIVLVELGGWQKAKQFARKPDIEVSSATSPFSDSYISGEKLTFRLHNVEAARVFWVFDEAEVLRGSVETEYRFAFSEEQPTGRVGDHRVDAFYKVEGDYHSTKRYVRVKNLNVHATIHTRFDQLFVSYPVDLKDRFQLSRANLAFLDEGRFAQDAAVELTRTSESGSAETVELEWDISPEFRASYVALARSHRRPWIELEFTDPQTDETLIVLNALEDKIQQPE